MNRLMQAAALMLLAAAALLGGCTHAVQADNPAVIEQDQYPVAFDNAVQTLRDQGFRIARNDYRFGVISTYPKEASTLAEPWTDDHTTRAQARRATLNAEQRVVTISFTPRDGSDDPATATGYDVLVQVLVERRRDPQRYLTHSASGYISRQYTTVPEHLQDRGIEGTYWQPIGQDELLEQRLMAQIIGAPQAGGVQTP